MSESNLSSQRSGTACVIKQTIWKFPLEITGVQEVRLPRGAKIISVANQNGVICLWAMVAPDSPLEPRIIFIYGTGHPLPEDSGRFLGSVLQDPFVWHVFEGTITP